MSVFFLFWKRKTASEESFFFYWRDFKNHNHVKSLLNKFLNRMHVVSFLAVYLSASHNLFFKMEKKMLVKSKNAI